MEISSHKYLPKFAMQRKKIHVGPQGLIWEESQETSQKCNEMFEFYPLTPKILEVHTLNDKYGA